MPSRACRNLDDLNPEEKQYLRLKVYNYLIIVLASSIFFGGLAYADIGIILSNSCVTMLKNNLSTNCPTYEQLNLLFPDTSEKKISGDFVTIDGYYHRENSKYNRQYNYYKYSDESITWIDPPADTIEKIPRVIIQPRDFTYKINNQILNNSSTYMVGENRYVSSTCTYAIISADNWTFLLGDTVQYLLKNCDPEYTNFNENKTIIQYKTYHDITTSYKYQLDKWFKESKEKAKSYLIPK